MPGIKTTYTLRNADVCCKYARDRWAWVYGHLPDGPIVAVCIVAHGGGWIAPSNLPDIQFDPTHEILDKDQTDAFLVAGIAVFWMEYPPGYQTNAQARVAASSRWPQIPRIMGMVKQFLHTHALNGHVTRDTGIALPEDDSKYFYFCNSAASLMGAWIALQPDGFLPYSPNRRASDRTPFAYTRSHRVGGVVATDFPTDLTRYGGSAAALPLVGWPGVLIKESTGVAAMGGPAGRFDVVPVDIKRAMSPISNVGVSRNDTLFGIFAANSGNANEASYFNSGLSVNIDPTKLTGTPVVGETVTASGGAAGILRAHNVFTDYLYLDKTSGTVAQFTGTLAFGTSGAALATGGLLLVTGSDTFPTILDEAEALAEWDSAEVPLEGVAEHSCIYLPPFRRARAAHFTAEGATNLDRYYIGNDYVASLDGNTAAFPWNGLSITTEILDWLENTLGMI